MASCTCFFFLFFSLSSRFPLVECDLQCNQNAINLQSNLLRLDHWPGEFLSPILHDNDLYSPPKKTIILQLQNDCVEILNTCQVNHWQHISPSVTHVTALVEVTDRCKVLMSTEPDPPEERLTTSYGSHPPIRGHLHTRILRAQQMVKTCVTQWLWTQRCSYANWRIKDRPFDFRLLRSTPLMWPWGFKSEAKGGSHCRSLVNIAVRRKVQTKALDRQHCQCKAFNRIACLTEQSTVLYYTRAIVSPHANRTVFPAIYISIML